MSTEKDIASWGNPIIPAWMNTINDKSFVSWKEIAPIFGSSLNNFKRAFLLRYEKMIVVKSKDFNKPICTKPSNKFKRPDLISMRDVRALVFSIQNDR
jgi:hypothetical protein